MPMYAPLGDKGGGGASEIPEEGADDGFQLSESDLDFEGDDGTGPILERGAEEEDEDGISFDEDGNIDKLFAPDEDDDDDNSDGTDDSEREAAAQAKLTADMKAAITGMSIPEAAIPADFDPSDPKQFRDVLGAIQRQTAQDTMRIMWQPVAAALQSTIKNIRAEIEASVEGGIGTNNMKSMLATAIPNYTRPAVKAIVDPILAQARKKYPDDPRKAVAATRKTLIGLGVRIGAPGDKARNVGGRGGGRQSATERTNAVLDQFMKLPKAVANIDSRLQNRLQRPKP